MSVAPTDWTRLASGGRAGFCALIAGYEFPITNVMLTNVVWTADPDTAWHAGTSGITSKPWYDDSLPLVISERVSPVQGELEIGAVTLALHDPNTSAREGEVSALIANRASMPATAVTATLSATDTTVHLENTSGLATSGTGFIGRESVAWTGKTSTTLTGLSRGLHGSRARVHAFVSSAVRPTFYANPDGVVSLPSILGRRVTLWVLPMNDTTATDPQLVFDGRVGPGVALRDGGWSIPLLHAIKSLEAKFRKVNVVLAGIQHGVNTRSASILQAPSEVNEPLAVRWGASNAVLNAGDNGGWSPDRDTFLSRWNGAVRSDLPPAPFILVASFLPDYRVALYAEDSTDQTLTLCADWASPERQYSPGETDTDSPVSLVTSTPFPEAFVALSGIVHLRPSDAAQLPAPPTLSAGATVTSTRANWTLRAEINGGTRVSRMGAVTTDTVSLAPAHTYSGPRDLRMLTPTVATLGLWCESSTWYNALHFGILPALDGFQGADFLADSIDFVRVQQVVSQSAAALDPVRRYDLNLEDGLIGLIRNECAMSGLVLCTYRGRLSVARIHEVSPTEPLAAQITEHDLRAGESPTLSEVHDGLATAWTLTLPDKRVVQIIDESAEAEFGKGVEIKVDGASIVSPGRLLDSGAVDALTAQAMAVLGPFSRAYQMATIPLSLAHAGLQVGDVVTIEEWLLPDGYGARGLNAVPAQIMGVSRGLGTGAVNIDVLLSRPDLSGYAPEALVAAISGPILTIDNTALGMDQGPRGFCDRLLPDGSERFDGGASAFNVGDKVVLLELDSETPATPEHFMVMNVSNTTVILSGSPSAAFTSIVAPGTVRVMLAFDDSGAATANQRRYCYIADGATQVIDGAQPARHYAN